MITQWLEGRAKLKKQKNTFLNFCVFFPKNIKCIFEANWTVTYFQVKTLVVGGMRMSLVFLNLPFSFMRRVPGVAEPTMMVSAVDLSEPLPVEALSFIVLRRD